MTRTIENAWEDAKVKLKDAKGASFDGCHKIYILMDTPQMAQSKMWGYGEDGSYLVSFTADWNLDARLGLIQGWWKQAQECGLEFISSVRTVPGDPNEGYEDIIGQGEFDEVPDYDPLEYDGLYDDEEEDATNE